MIAGDAGGEPVPVEVARHDQGHARVNVSSFTDGVAGDDGVGQQTDKASGAFQTSYDEFTTGATKTIQGLEGLSSFLKSSADAFSQVDQQLSSAIKG